MTLGVQGDLLPPSCIPFCRWGLVQSSGFTKPLVGAVVLLTIISTLASLALPALAREAPGVPFIEVQPADVVPQGGPSNLAFTAADRTIPDEQGAPEEGQDPDAADPADPTDPADPADPETPELLLPDPEPKAANDLSDIPPYPPPAGFEVLQTWDDGDNAVRATIWAAAAGDEAALVVYISGDRGGWTSVDISDVAGVDPSRQWLYEQPPHPYCLWIEYSDKGLEREGLERASGLVGPQFLVVETPFCKGLPDPYT